LDEDPVGRGDGLIGNEGVFVLLEATDCADLERGLRDVTGLAADEVPVVAAPISALDIIGVNIVR
jgi:hypothetical protein